MNDVGWKEIFLREHSGLKIFPREVMALNSEKKIFRTTINDKNEFTRFFSRFGTDCYTSVFSEWQQKKNVYDTILIDVDGEDINESYLKFKLVKKLLSKYSLRCYCSGQGFHIYIDFKPMHFIAFTDTVSKWVEEIGIKELIDTRCSADIRRMIRVPYTINSRNKRFAVPIDKTDSKTLVRLRRRIGKGNTSYENVVEVLDNNRRVRERLGELDGRSCPSFQRKIKGIGYFQKHSNLEDFPNCIKRMTEEMALTGELDHIPRLALSMFLVRVWSLKRIDELFERTMKDYNRNYTSYQLNFLARKKYNTYGCGKIKGVGYCSFKEQSKCPFSPNMTGWC